MKEKILDLEKLKKQFADCEKSLKDVSSAWNNSIDKMVKDIVERHDNHMAMEFTRVIGELLIANGVKIKTQEYTVENARENSIEYRCGVSITGLDFTEHDKKFKDKLDEKEKDYKTVSSLLSQCQMENDGLKQWIADLETKIHERDKRITELYEELKMKDGTKMFETLLENTSGEAKELLARHMYENLECVIRGHKSCYERIKELEEQLQNPAETEDVICSMSPIQVADYLIEHTRGFMNPFEIPDLEQIAEHLLVYCRHNKENEE